MKEFRVIKLSYVEEYRRQTLTHKRRIDFYSLARDVVLSQLLGCVQIRHKLKRNNCLLTPNIIQQHQSPQESLKERHKSILKKQEVA
jgi:hypothetical protein